MDHEAFQFPSVETMFPAQFPGRRICFNPGIAILMIGNAEPAQVRTSEAQSDYKTSQEIILHVHLISARKLYISSSLLSLQLTEEKERGIA